MKVFLSFIIRFLRSKKFLFLLLACPFLVLLPACKKPVDYFSYASEVRSNIFFYKDDTFLLKVHAVKREQPYVADGIARESVPLCEIFLTAPSGNENCEIYFSVDGKKYGGDMSYDGVKAEYYFSCTLDISSLSKIDFSLCYGGGRYEISAKSVVDEAVLSPKLILTRLTTEYKPLFERLTDKYGFQGEIYIRLLFEDSPYYFVGVIERDGKTTAFLLNAVSGKILASRESE